MKKMTQLCFNIILFTSLNQNKSLNTYFFQYNLKFFQTDALVLEVIHSSKLLGKWSHVINWDGHSIWYTEGTGLKFHTGTQVGVMFLKFTKLTNSKVGNNVSIGMRVPNPRMMTSFVCYGKLCGVLNGYASPDWLIWGK